MTAHRHPSGHPDRQNRKLTQAHAKQIAINATHSGRFDTILCVLLPVTCQPRAESDIASGMPTTLTRQLRPFSSVIS